MRGGGGTILHDCHFNDYHLMQGLLSAYSFSGSKSATVKHMIQSPGHICPISHRH